MHETSPVTAATIRAIAPGDAEMVAELAAQLGYPAAAAEIVARLERLAGAAGHGAFVADVGGKVVGWVHIHEVLTVQYAPVAEVSGLVVDATHRSQRIGEALLSAAEAWAREREYAVVNVRSRVMRVDAHRFYERLGYANNKTSYLFTKSLAP